MNSIGSIFLFHKLIINVKMIVMCFKVGPLGLSPKKIGERILLKQRWKIHTCSSSTTRNTQKQKIQWFLSQARTLPRQPATGKGWRSPSSSQSRTDKLRSDYCSDHSWHLFIIFIERKPATVIITSIVLISSVLIFFFIIIIIMIIIFIKSKFSLSSSRLLPIAS